MERPGFGGDDRGKGRVFEGRQKGGERGGCGQWKSSPQGSSGDNEDLGAPSTATQEPTAVPERQNSSNNNYESDEDDWDAPAKKPSVLTLEVCSTQSTETSNFDPKDFSDIKSNGPGSPGAGKRNHNNSEETADFYDCETHSSSRDDKKKGDDANNSRAPHKHSTRPKRPMNMSPENSDELHEPLTKKKIICSGSLSFGSQPLDSLEHLVTLSGKIQFANTEEQPISNFVSKGIFSQGGFLASIHDESQEDTVNVSQGTCITQHDSDGSSQETLAVSSARKSTRTSRSSAKTVDNRPASERAFSVDLIRKYIFTNVDVPTLKACREVCKHWDKYASEELEHRVIITLSFGHCVLNYPKFRSVSSLIGLMNTSNSEKLFPFTAFEISTKELSSPRIQELFDSVGAHMTKLHLSLDYVNQQKTFEQSSLMHDLSHLLINQVPNLEFLEIKSSLPGHWWENLKKWDANPTAVNPTFFLRENGGGNIINAYLLPKLKALHLSGSLISKKVLQDIMDAAVNLRCYHGPSYPSEMLQYFIDGKGKDRLHLLKKLYFILDTEGKGNIGTMERLLEKQHHQGNLLQLESLLFFCTRPSIDTTALCPRAVHILNQLLSSSSNTLKELVINPMRFLEGLTIPRLPIKLLFLDDNSLDDSSNNYFFPQGFSLANAFPLVRYIGILSDFNSNSIRLLDILEPIPHVKRIVISRNCSISDLAVSALALKFPQAYIKHN